MQQKPALDLGQILNVFSKISPEQWRELGLLAQSSTDGASAAEPRPEIISAPACEPEAAPKAQPGAGIQGRDIQNDADAQAGHPTQSPSETISPPPAPETPETIGQQTQRLPSQSSIDAQVNAAQATESRDASAPASARRQRAKKAVALSEQPGRPEIDVPSAVHGAADDGASSNTAIAEGQNINNGQTCALASQNLAPAPQAAAEMLANLSLDALDLLAHKMAKAPLPAQRCPFVPLVGAVNASAASGALIAYDPEEIDAGGEAGFTDGLVLALNKKYLSQLAQNDQASGLPYSAWTAPFMLFALSQKAKALGASPVCSINKMAATRQMKCAIHPDDDSVRIRLVSTKDMRQILSRSSDAAAIALCERLGADPIRDKSVCAAALRKAIRLFPKDPVLSWAGPEPASDPCGFFSDAAAFAKLCLETPADARSILEKYNNDAILLPLFEIAAAAELRCLIPSGPEGASVAVSAMNSAHLIPATALLSVCSIFDGQPDLLRQIYAGIKSNPAVAPQIKLAVLESLLNC